jgi:DUF177 domain-containing protein
MPIAVNLRHLEENDLHLNGELLAEDLELGPMDELITANQPLRYDLEVEQTGPNLFIHGSLRFELGCECSRCLRPFKFEIVMDPYTALVPLEGEDKVEVSNDVVDLTPYLREDILLAFPQHPLCEAECDRLPPSALSLAGKLSGTSAPVRESAWDELNKLKFK